MSATVIETSTISSVSINDDESTSNNDSMSKALQLLREAAVENELVIDDPEPIITLEGFGDNSLNLVLRCYLDTLDNRLDTISKLHQAINNKFEQAGIVISFPQRDIHIDTLKPLEIYLSQ